MIPRLRDSFSRLRPEESEVMDKRSNEAGLVMRAFAALTYVIVGSIIIIMSHIYEDLGLKSGHLPQKLWDNKKIQM